MNTLKDNVIDVLERFPFSRNSDDALYVKVLCRINPDVQDMHFTEVMCNRKELGLPNIESVSRMRRKVCETRPDLRGTEKVQQGRAELAEEFREWAVME